MITEIPKKIIAKYLDREKKDILRKSIYEKFYNLDVGIGTRIVSPSEVGGKTKIGRYTNLQENVQIRGGNGVKIGDFCAIAENVRIQSTNHSKDQLSMQYRLYNTYLNLETPKVKSGGIKIGNDVWIGSNAIILSGVEIGNGAIIGAGAVVTKNVDDFEIVGGVPAENIGYRFNEEIRRKLEKIEWWNWEMDEIKKNRELFEGKLTEHKISNFTK